MSWAQRTSWGGNRIQKLKIKKRTCKTCSRRTEPAGGQHCHLSGADRHLSSYCQNNPMSAKNQSNIKEPVHLMADMMRGSFFVDTSIS